MALWKLNGRMDAAEVILLYNGVHRCYMLGLGYVNGHNTATGHSKPLLVHYCLQAQATQSWTTSLTPNDAEPPGRPNSKGLLTYVRGGAMCPSRTEFV